MMNSELLFRASDVTGDASFNEIAVEYVNARSLPSKGYRSSNGRFRLDDELLAEGIWTYRKLPILSLRIYYKKIEIAFRHDGSAKE